MTMKKASLSILFVALLLTGCDKDFLNRYPLDSYSNETLWKTASDANSALAGCYSGWEYGDNVIYDDCTTDNAYDQFPAEGFETFASSLATASNAGVGKYDYTTIQRCNWFLDNVDKTPMDATLMTRMKGEARFLRAYRYFVMSQCYGDVPLVLHSVTPSEANAFSRTPKSDVVKYILDELTAIAPALPVSYSGSDIGRITRGAVLGLKARVELYNGKYTDCIATCQQLMSSTFNYSLYPSYTDLFRPQNSNNQEVILDVQYLMNNNSEWVLGVLLPNSLGGWSSVAPLQSLVDTYETINGKTIQDDPTYNPLQPYQNRDPRLEASIVHPGSFYAGSYFNPYKGDDIIGGNNASPSGYNFKKYVSDIDDYNGTAYGTDIWNTGGSIIVMRYAEILLTYAEAKIESNQIDASVYKAINDVRQRAGMPVVTAATYPDQASLRTLVRRERRVEFAGEGLRYYDIQRWKIAETVMNGKIYGCPQGSVDSNTGALTLTPNSNVEVATRDFSSKYYLFPIPQSEIIIDKNLTQNSGY
jgi:hypothetical protein